MLNKLKNYLIEKEKENLTKLYWLMRNSEKHVIKALIGRKKENLVKKIAKKEIKNSLLAVLLTKINFSCRKKAT